MSFVGFHEYQGIIRVSHVVGRSFMSFVVLGRCLVVVFMFLVGLQYFGVFCCISVCFSPFEGFCGMSVDVVVFV